MHKYIKGVALSLAVTVLTGCAAPVVRTVASDKSIKSAAVISLLDEQTKVQRIGLTVFNNKSVVVDQAGELNIIAIDTIEAMLRKSRPDWDLKDARGDVPALLAAKKAGGVSLSTQVSAFSKDLGSLAEKLNVDLLFVVIDTKLENLPGEGVGIHVRTMKLSSVNEASVHAVNLVVLVDRKGNEITNRWGGEAAFATVQASALGIDYDLTKISSAETQQKLKVAMQNRLKAAITAATEKMGY